MKIQKLTLFRYLLPFHKPLLLSSLSYLAREGLLLRGVSDQREIWREISPLTGYSRESLQDSIAQITTYFKTMRKGDFTLQSIVDGEFYPSVSWGLASVFFAAAADLPAKICPLVTEDALDTFPYHSPCVKLKVGGGPIENDINKIKTILADKRFSGVLRLDANQQWDYPDIQQLNGSVDIGRIEWLEDPLKPGASYSEWAQNSRIPFAYDERLYQCENTPVFYPGLKALILKPTLLGYVKTRAMMHLARRWQCQLIVSSSFESPVGMATLHQFAKDYANEEYQGLDTLKYFSKAHLQNLQLMQQGDFHHLEMLAELL